jgi:hydrogenase maturation protease
MRGLGVRALCARLTERYNPARRLHELIALRGAAGSSPQRVVLWGMEPGTSEPGLELTPECEAHLDDLVDAVVRELRAWGADVRPIPERSVK